MPAMHATLPQDVVRRIMRWADLSSLAQLAVVSKNLHGHAVAELYGELEGPEPLLQLLPMVAMGSYRYGFNIEKPIQPEPLARFLYIATKVRRFIWTEQRARLCSGCFSFTMMYLYGLVSDGTLFPMLQWLKVCCFTTEGVQAILPCLSRSIRTLDLAFGPNVNDTFIVSCLLRIKECCSSVTSFAFTVDRSADTPCLGIIDALIDALKAMPNLRSVKLTTDLVSAAVRDVLTQHLRLNALAIVAPMETIVLASETTSALFSDSVSDHSIELLPPLHFDIGPLPTLPDTPESHSNAPIASSPAIQTSYFYSLYNQSQVSTRSRNRTIPLPEEEE